MIFYLCSMRIFIVGYMGCGKSTFGPKLANALQLPFYDLDILFEERYKISIQNFFSKYGENHFREFEHQILTEAAENEEFVLSTGGGTPCFFDQMNFMNQKGATLFLNPPFEVIVKRLKTSPKKRPLLQRFGAADFEKKLHEHFMQREVCYRQSTFNIEEDSPSEKEVAERILKYFSKLS